MRVPSPIFIFNPLSFRPLWEYFTWDRTRTQDDIIKDLEQPTISAKINGIKQAILLLLSGETLPRFASIHVLFLFFRWVITQGHSCLSMRFRVCWCVVWGVCFCVAFFVIGSSRPIFLFVGLSQEIHTVLVAQTNLISRAVPGVLPGDNFDPCAAPSRRPRPPFGRFRRLLVPLLVVK